MEINGTVFEMEDIDWVAVRQAYKELLVEMAPILRATDKYLEEE
jgi:hypothetical protein